MKRIDSEVEKALLDRAQPDDDVEWESVLTQVPGVIPHDDHFHFGVEPGVGIFVKLSRQDGDDGDMLVAVASAQVPIEMLDEDEKVRETVDGIWDELVVMGYEVTHDDSPDD